MDEEHVFRHVLFLYDENTQIQIIGNVMLQLDIVQQICTRESFFYHLFLKATTKLWLWAR